MARIPTSADIRGPGSLRTGRAIARQDTTAIGRGMADMGRGVQQIGAGLTSFAKQQIDKQNTLDVARAEVTKTEGLLGVSNSFSQGGEAADANYSTYGSRARAASEAAVNEAAQLIRDPEMRERWKLTALSDALRTADGAADRGLALENQQQIATFEETLDANQRLFTDPTLPREVQERARADIQGSIEMAVATGLATPAQAAQWKTTYLDNADYTRAQLEVQRNPDAIYGTASATATAGAVTGVVSAGAGYTVVQLPDGTVERREGTRAWRNNNPGNIEFGPFAQSRGAVGSDGRFAVFPTYEAGREAKRALLFESGSYRNLSLSAAIARYAPAFENDTGSYTAQVAQAAGVSPDTPLSALSEDQQQAMLDAMERVEGFRPGRTSEQEGAGSTGAAPDWFTRLPPNQQAAIRQEAATARNAKSAETRARIEMAAQDAPVAIQNTGQYTGYQPTSEDFLAAYGPVAAPQQYAQYQQSIDTSNQAYTMRNVSISDINAMVAAARPTATGEGAAMEQQRFETLSAAAEQTITARTEDPARYTLQNFPRVAEAWEQAAVDPTQVRSAMTMTWAAQNQLGIPAASRQLLPNNVAEHAVQNFQNAEIPERDRVGAVTSLIFSSPDVEQQRAVFSQLVEAGLPEISEGAMDAMARGDEGAARRLFLAAMVDPSDLPGSLPTGVTPARISEEVQSQLMDVGSVGDLYYGLSDGSAENFERAQRDQQLIQNAVQLRLRAGESLRDAVASVGKDLYGDVRVVDGNWNVNARLLLPADQDPSQTLRGLEATLPQVRQTLTESLVPAGDAPVGEASAIIDAATENYINNVMNDGYFRNTEGGYVFIDPFVGAAISDVEGNPIVFTESDMVQAAAQAPSQTMSREQANAMLEANEINEEQHRMLMQEISEQEQRAMGLIE